jgi:hypothetical protein
MEGCPSVPRRYEAEGRLRVSRVGSNQEAPAVSVRSTPNSDREFEDLAFVAVCQ